SGNWRRACAARANDLQPPSDERPHLRTSIMNWLSNFVRPKIRALVRKENVPENLWHKCPSCEQMIFHRELATNLFVCTHCNHHLRVGAKDRLDMVFDEDSYQLVELPDTIDDPLRFRDQKR